MVILNDDHVICAADIQILRVINKVRFGVLGNNVEPVLRWDGDGFNQTAVYGV